MQSPNEMGGRGALVPPPTVARTEFRADEMEMNYRGGGKNMNHFIYAALPSPCGYPRQSQTSASSSLMAAKFHSRTDGFVNHEFLFQFYWLWFLLIIELFEDNCLKLFEKMIKYIYGNHKLFVIFIPSKQTNSNRPVYCVTFY